MRALLAEPERMDRQEQREQLLRRPEAQHSNQVPRRHPGLALPRSRVQVRRLQVARRLRPQVRLLLLLVQRRRRLETRIIPQRRAQLPRMERRQLRERQRHREARRLELLAPRRGQHLRRPRRMVQYLPVERQGQPRHNRRTRDGLGKRAFGPAFLFLTAPYPKILHLMRVNLTIVNSPGISLRMPAEPSPPPIKDPPQPPENPDVPVREPEPDVPNQI